jgi:uncharacterized protein
MSIDINEAKISKQIAQANLERLRRQLPHKLAEREDKLFKKFRKDLADPIRKLKKLYIFMDELYAIVAKFTPCKLGCSACCYYPISISEIEIGYIEQSHGIERTTLKALSPHSDTPCPFLTNNSCSIYETRPFVCRRHISLDKSSTWCQLDVCDKIELPQVVFSEVAKTYEQIVSESDSPSWIDIREAFNPFPIDPWVNSAFPTCSARLT